MRNLSLLTWKEIKEIRKMIIRKYAERDLPEIIRIWNEVVEEGIAFPQEELLNSKSGAVFPEDFV